MDVLNEAWDALQELPAGPAKTALEALLGKADFRVAADAGAKHGMDCADVVLAIQTFVAKALLHAR